jgi:hypothetical protein
MYWVVGFCNFLLLRIIFRLFQYERLNVLMKFSIIFYIILWQLIPGVAFFFLSKLENSGNLDIDLNGFAFLFTGEVCALWIILRFILKWHSKLSFLDSEKSIKISDNLFFLMWILYLFIIAFNTFYTSNNYLENNDYTKDVSVFAGILFFFSSLTAGVFTIWTIRISSIKMKILSILLILFNVVSDLMKGSRIAMVWLIFLLVLYIYLYLKSHRIGTLKLLVSSFFIIVLFYGSMIVSKSIASTRGDSDYGLNVISFDAVGYLEVIDDLFTKFNSLSAGVSLIKNYGAGSSGLGPYEGSFLIFIPRLLWKNKPVPGSINRTYSGTPARLVPAIEDSGNTVQNVGVSPLAISIWHFGYVIGYLIFIFSNIINLILFHFLTSSRSLFLNALALFMIPIPGFYNIIQSPDVIVKHLVLMIFMWFIYQSLSIIFVKVKSSSVIFN